MYKLIIEDDEGKTTVVPLIRDEITIGRKEGNTIRLTERNVSRRHAKLVKQERHDLYRGPDLLQRDQGQWRPHRRARPGTRGRPHPDRRLPARAQARQSDAAGRAVGGGRQRKDHAVHPRERRRAGLADGSPADGADGDLAGADGGADRRGGGAGPAGGGVVQLRRPGVRAGEGGHGHRPHRRERHRHQPSIDLAPPRQDHPRGTSTSTSSICSRRTECASTARSTARSSCARRPTSTSATCDCGSSRRVKISSSSATRRWWTWPAPGRVEGRPVRGARHRGAAAGRWRRLRALEG